MKLKLLATSRDTILNRPQAVTGLCIFLTCVFVYLINDRVTLTSSDNVTSTLLAFNWLENHTLHFDNFREGHFYEGMGIPYFLVEAANGHVTSRYPAGTAIVTFPLYCIFFIYLKIASLVQSLASGVPINLLNVTDDGFEMYRRSYGKLAAVLSSALTVVIFYFSTRLKFNQSIALIATFIFAFATGTWVICSQDLRQHTISNLLLISSIFCLLKVERTSGTKRNVLLLTTGFFCGLLPGVRVTSAIFSVAIAAYVIYTYRKQAIFFLLGLPSVLFHLGWNLYYFGWNNVLVGGYVKHLEERPHSYAFTFQQFKTASLGLLISPSDGFFTYSPVLLFSLPGAYRVFKLRVNRDERLLLCLTLTCFALYLHYCFYLFWMGGTDSYGSRVLTDTLPVACLLIAYALQQLIDRLKPQQWLSPVLAIFLLSLILSTAIQTIGAFTQTQWGNAPMPIFADKSRVWKLQDNQIERHFRNLLVQVSDPITDEQNYVQNLSGTLEQIEAVNRNGKSKRLSPVLSGQRKVLRAVLRNTGRSQWFGYQTALEDAGETRIKIRFYNSNGQEKKQRGGDILYVSGTPKTGEQTEATGLIAFPKQPGQYQMVFNLFADGISDSDDDSKNLIYQQDVTVRRKKNQ